METFKEYLDSIEQPMAREKMQEALSWVAERFPQLGKRVAWNQPMFTDHGTFIISFSAAKDHLTASPEGKTLRVFDDELKHKGYRPTKMIFRMPWSQPLDKDLLERIIIFNMEDKKDSTSFWRPKEDWG